MGESHRTFQQTTFANHLQRGEALDLLMGRYAESAHTFAVGTAVVDCIEQPLVADCPGPIVIDRVSAGMTQSSDEGVAADCIAVVI